MGPKPGKNSGYSKVTGVLTSHFRGMLIVVFLENKLQGWTASHKFLVF